MIGKTISHYKILEKLGEGGMGVVYKAKDTKLNREVAIKFLPKELLRDSQAKQRFLQEAQAAAALNHPNICTIFETDEFEEQSFIVMEYIDGENLRKKIESGILFIKDAMSFAIQIAEGLQEAHEKGIIHRDIKSANIMVTRKGQAKITDFGLAKLAGQVGITKPGTTLGTAAYMSPEQAQGIEVDSRSDVWSYGVVLYELLSGQRPFKGEYEQAVIYSILNEAPVPLLHLRPEIPGELERIVNQALAKNKTDRYQNMAQMLDDLKALKEDLEAGVLKERPRISVPFILAGEEEVEVPELICVGREKEFARLNKFLDKMLGSKGQVVFVTGEAGSGKTTLIQAFIHRAQKLNKDLIVASGKCDAHTGIGDPYLPFREVLSLLTGDVEALWEAGAITKDHAVRLWNLFPLSVQTLINDGPDLIDTFVPGEGLVRRSIHYTHGRAEWLTQLKKLVERKVATASFSALQQSDLFKQYANLLQTLSRHQPLLLILDDLQWADSGSINLLFHIGRRIEGNRILIVGAYRSAEVALGRTSISTGQRERHPLEPVVNEFKGVYGDFELGLDQAEGRHFVDAFVDTETNRLSTSFRDMLFRQTEGHALFTVELLRGMREQGVLVQDEKGRWIEGTTLNWETLPARVDAVVGERIARLPESLGKVLTLASIEGEEFTAEVVARLHGTNDREMIQLLSSELDKRYNLVSAKGIQRMNGRRLSLYRFRHVLFQKYLYTSLDEVERVYLHEEVGNVLENLYGEEVDEIAVQLARHFREAGMTEKALNYLIKAANQAKQVYANEEAIELFQKALDTIKAASLPESKRTEQHELTTQILDGLGDVQELLGRHDDARISYQEALSQAPKRNVIWHSRLNRKIGKTYEVQRLFDDALKTFTLAESVLGSQPVQPEKDWWYEWIEIHNERMWHHYWLAQLDEMTKLANRVQPIIEQYGIPEQRAKFFNGITLLAYRRDRYFITDETLNYSRAAVSASKQSENLNSMRLAHFLLGFSLLWKGELDEGEEQILIALKLTEQAGDIILQSRCLTYLTITYRMQGKVEKVRYYIPQCEAVAQSGQMIEYVGTARANEAWVAWREGDLSKAYANGQAALECWKQVPAGHASCAFQWTALLPLIGVSIIQERTSQAVDYARALLDPSQLLLPDKLKTCFEEAINIWNGGGLEATRTKLDQAIAMARQMRYL